MRRNTLNFLIDIASFLVILGMACTGLVMALVLPPGSGGTRSLWSLGRHDWGDVHWWLAISLGVLLLVHLALHWRWICTTLTQWVNRSATASSGTALRRNLIGAAALLALAALISGFVGLAYANVKFAPGGGRHSERAAAPQATPPLPRT